MKKAILFAVCSLLFGMAASAQCWHPSYSAYTSHNATSANSNPDPTLAGAAYTLYQTVSVTGTTTIDFGCSIIMNAHVPRVTNTISTTGGTTYGPAVYPTAYMSYSTTVSKGDWIGIQETQFSDTELFCSSAGNFWGDDEPLLSLEIAYTKSINSGIVKSTNCKHTDGTPCTIWYINSYCTTDTTPPDYNPSDFTAPSYLSADSVRYIYQLGACARVNVSGVPWVCLPQAALGLPGTSTRGSCTHNP